MSAATYVLTRSIAVSFYLSRVGSNSLPLALAASAVSVIAISMVTRLVIRFIPARACVGLSWMTFAATTFYLASVIVVNDHHVPTLLLLDVLAEVRGSLNTVYTITMANDAFANESSKRPYVIVASGAPIAGIIAGAVLSLEATAIRDTHWLMIIASLDIATMLLIRWLPRHQARDLSFELEPIATHKAEVAAQLPANSWRPYRYGLAALVGLKVCVLTLIGYQWQMVVGDYFHENEAKLIAYFAAFYAISDLLIVTVQWFASGKLLDRFGVGLPLKAFPIALDGIGVLSMSAGLTGLGVASALIVTFTAARGLNVLRRSLHDPGLAAAYSIIDPRVRSQTIVFVKGMIKPFAEAVVSIALLFYADVIAFDWITCLWMLLIVPWFIAATWVSTTYRHARGGVTESLRQTPRSDRQIKQSTPGLPSRIGGSEENCDCASHASLAR